ncbi:MAG: FtsX-like permease family protein [Chloroflexi bacterium]|nr:FtsX-like permease family protein [Chloroflexota bacterium]
MMRLALQTLRWRWPSVVGAFGALTCAMAIVGAIGILGEPGARGADGPVERYASVPIVVAASQSLVLQQGDADVSHRLPERARVPLDTLERISAVPGVAGVVADVTVPAIVTSAGGDALVAEDGTPPPVAGWSSSALAPFALIAGEAPANEGQVVIDTHLAQANGLGVGDTIVVVFATETRALTIAGIAAAPGGAASPVIFVADSLAAAASGDPSRVDALGVFVEDGFDATAVADAVRRAAGDGTQVYTGAQRAKAERPEIAAQNSDLVELSAAVGGLTVVLAITMIASILGLVVSQRLREVALLRTIGATPGQVRRLILGETLLVAVLAGFAGILPALALAQYLFGELQPRGVGGAYTSLEVGPLPLAGAFAVTLLTACLAAWLASRRAAKVRPTVALSEVGATPRRPGWFRLLIGLAALGGMIALAQVAFSQSGIAAAEASVGVLMTGLVAAGFLAQAASALVTTVVGATIGRISRGTGFLAMAHARAQSRRMSTVVALIAVTIGLTVTLIGTVTVPMSATIEQTRERLIADRVVHGAQGVPVSLDERLRATDGVAAVTRITDTSVALRYSELGESAFEFFPAAAITSNELAATLQLDVLAGSLDTLGPGDAIISEGLSRLTRSGVGDRLPVWLADGTAAEVQVVAIYARPWGLGDVLVAHKTLAGHIVNPLNSYLLIAFEEGAAAPDVEEAIIEIAGGVPGLETMDAAAWEAGISEAAEANAWVNYLILVVLGLFCAIAAVNSLVIATNDRASDFALLRLTGATRGQILRMVRWESGLAVATGLALGLGVAALTLVPFSQGIAETSLPALPWVAVGAIIFLTAALGVLGAELPARRILGSGREPQPASTR